MTWLSNNITITNFLTKFHEEVLTRITPPPPESHVFKQPGTIFELIQDIIKTNDLTTVLTRINVPPPCCHEQNNVLTKFHKDWTINVTSSVNKEKCLLPPGGHYKCSDQVHEDWTINVTFRVLTRKKAQTLGAIYIWTNLLTKFQDERTINVASRAQTRRDKNALSPGFHVFQQTRTIFELIQNIIELTRKTAQPPGFHVFQQTRTISKLIQDIIRTNVLTKFYKDWTTRCFAIATINVASTYSKKYAGCWSHVFQKTRTIFKLISIFEDIRTNVLTKCREDWTIHASLRVLSFYYIHIKCPAPSRPCYTIAIQGKMPHPTGGHVFQPTGIIFKLVQDIIRTNLLTKFHEDRTINVASRVLTSHVFQATMTIFELFQDIIETNLLNKFHEDWTII
ncbi:hypothetical protein DPMN_035146 [Dreissena polymorpha]|uniref:Uncharacterized protein n=1 Tax=Dreissena polymorpha TaxID=45954 RepID=A0A9D4MBC8_DREPO|nr:hypothetical protein DPMN_035146 [Dreissena polymorpha]